jgi:hypothetical protein
MIYRRSVSVGRQRRENIMPHQFEQLGKVRMFVRLPSDRYGVARYIAETGRLGWKIVCSSCSLRNYLADGTPATG